MSRLNLEDNLVRKARLLSPTHEVLKALLTGTFVISDDGPAYNFLDPGAATKSVYLPRIPPQGGLEYIVANLSSTQDLNIFDADGVAITTLQEGQVGVFFCSYTAWSYLTTASGILSDFVSGLLAEPRIVTGDFTVGPTDTTIAIQKTAPTTTAGTLPTVASRLGRPVRIVDWSSSVVDHVITLTPNGAEKIMKQSTWTLDSNAANLASVTLWPSTLLAGWYIVP